MVFGFYFNKEYTVTRRHRDGTVESFIAKGIGRMEYSVNIAERQFNIPKCFFIFSPAREIKTMDIVSDGNSKMQIGKVTVLNDIDGSICGYRCDNL